MRIPSTGLAVSRKMADLLRVERVTDDTGTVLWQLCDESADLELPNRFLRHLHYRSMSPNTIPRLRISTAGSNADTPLR